ncbi:2-oxo-4-hydroxy-4-carboxy-5-ureidoimidazoline decarboxylase [Labrys neptuniae]
MHAQHEDHDVANPTATSRRLDQDGFVSAFGNCFRGGAALAARAFETGVTIERVAVLTALKAQFRACTSAEKLEMLKAYTPLDPGVRAARIVADENQSDGLRAMTAAQQRRLLELLAVYTEKFGFDAIFVVRNYTTSQLLRALEARSATDLEGELQATYDEVEQLAEIQISAYFSDHR